MFHKAKANRILFSCPKVPALQPASLSSRRAIIRIIYFQNYMLLWHIHHWSRPAALKWPQWLCQLQKTIHTGYYLVLPSAWPQHRIHTSLLSGHTFQYAPSADSLQCYLSLKEIFSFKNVLSQKCTSQSLNMCTLPRFRIVVYTLSPFELVQQPGMFPRSVSLRAPNHKCPANEQHNTAS